eukprot:scaffold14596_cov59-Phaeocystis_antarctica.AAC.6
MQIKPAVAVVRQPLDISRFPAAQIKPLQRHCAEGSRVQHRWRLDGAIRLLLLARRALAHAHLAHAVHRAHDHRAHAARASVAAPAAHVRVVRHLGQLGSLQLHATEVNPLQVRPREVHTAQDRTMQTKRAVGATQPLDVSLLPAAQIKPLRHQRIAVFILCRGGAIRLLLLARRALAHAHLAHAVHRAHDHRALAARASVAAPAAHVRVVRHLERRGP